MIGKNDEGRDKTKNILRALLLDNQYEVVPEKS